MKTLYVLRLFNNRYYVGMTAKKIEKRFSEHLKGKGASWTRIYKPIDIEKTVSGDLCGFDEDCETKKYMYTYGIENVRGGSYSNINLFDTQLRILKREFDHNKQACLKCGRSGHFAKNCTHDIHIDGTPLYVRI